MGSVSCFFDIDDICGVSISSRASLNVTSGVRIFIAEFLNNEASASGIIMREATHRGIHFEYQEGKGIVFVLPCLGSHRHQTVPSEFSMLIAKATMFINKLVVRFNNRFIFGCPLFSFHLRQFIF